MRLRDLFRGPSNAERKSTISLSNSSLVPVLDVNTFVNAAQDKDTDLLHKYLLAANNYLKEHEDHISGFPPDQPDPSTKATALHLAVESANLRAIQMLLQAGAQVNVTDGNVSTPLHIAAYMGYEEIVQTLISHGADLYKQDNTGRNAFHLAISTGNLRLIQHFLSTNETEQNLLHTPDAQNWTPLMCACASNHPAICAFLLSCNADLCAMNDRGMTAMHIAAFLGSSSVLQELLTSSSSSNDEVILRAINQVDHRNQTALFQACIEGHLEIALTLLRAGANAYHLDNDEQTCLHAMLSSSIILKRHIRLFYSLIQFVDYRFNQDYLGRTLLDLAYLHQINTLTYLLILLNYRTNSDIVFNSEEIDTRAQPLPNEVLSLRHICIVAFKRSIIYHRNERQTSQHNLLEHALQQTFHIPSDKEFIQMKETRPIGKSLDDISLLQQQQQHQSSKYQKNAKPTKAPEKKLKKPPSIFSSTSSANKWSSQIDLQHTQSTWSVLTNKFKGQRLPPVTASVEQIHSFPSSATHPMKNLAFDLLTSPMKLHHLLDFPSLEDSHLLHDDLQMSINTYHLLSQM